MAGSRINLSQLAGHMAGRAVPPPSSKMWKQVGQALENDAKDSFDASRSPDGTPWSPLRYPRPRGGNKPLLDTGMLRASLTNNGRGHVRIESQSSLEWGTNLQQAMVHQHGAVIVPKKGKFLAIPTSVEALRAGSPLRFPDAKNRLGWLIGTKGGIVYEKPKRKGKKGGKGPKGTKKKRFGRLRKWFRKIVSRLKKLNIRIQKLRKRLARARRRGGKAIAKIIKQLTMAKRKRASIRRTKKAAKGKQNRKRNVKTFQYRGQTLVVHFILTKRVSIPARPFIGISKNAEAVIMEIMFEHAARTFVP